MNKQKQDLAIYSISVATLLAFYAFMISTAWIGYGVKNNCQKAQSQFEGDCVEALMQTVEADFATNVGKNSAIWTLGQLGDNRALPLLESKFTGVIPNHEPWDTGISQYELSKAIKLLKGGINIPSTFWR